MRNYCSAEALFEKKMGGRRMTLTAEQVQKDLDNLPQRYKTPDVDCLIQRYVKQKAILRAASSLRSFRIMSL